MIFTENFRQAIQDYIFLLEKKYPEKTIHEMVSTRYALNHFERSMLYRGITTKEKADNRKNKLITIEQLNNRTIHIDLFNVLFTVAAYLRGFPLYVSNDDFLRDASEGHDSHEWVDQLYKALELLMNYLDELKISKAVIYLDNPLHISSQVAQMIETRAEDLKTAVEIILDQSPDHLIRSVTEGALATSDSTIIDKSSLPILDLPKNLLESKFHKQFINIINI
jgi:hypothetical protein